MTDTMQRDRRDAFDRSSEREREFRVETDHGHAFAEDLRVYSTGRGRWPRDVPAVWTLSKGMTA